MSPRLSKRRAYKNHVTEALQSAIADVGRGEFDRRSRPMRRRDVPRRVESALRELDKLRRGEMPDYDDPWVALFYTLWYQASHINLAYSTLLELMDNGVIRIPSRGGMRFVDFGAGALAAQIGTVLALADPDHRLTSKNITRIKCDAVDASKPMLRIGQMIWLRFKGETRQRHLAKVIRAVSPAYLSDVGKIQTRGNPVGVLTAFHAVYDDVEVRDEISESLATLNSNLSPSVFVITAHSGREGSAVRISPFRREALRNIAEDVAPALGGTLRKVTDLRKEIWTEIAEAARSECDDADFVRKFLTSKPTEWDLPNAAILVYNRES